MPIDPIIPSTPCVLSDLTPSQVYPLMRVGGDLVYQHRHIFESFWGEIPTGLEIDHRCNNPRCIRFDHLRAVTKQENVSRQPRYLADTCPNGHYRTPENIYRHKGRNRCRECNREAVRRYRTLNPR